MSDTNAPSVICSTCLSFIRSLIYTTTTTTTILRPLGLCPRLPGWAGTRKVKPIWIYWSKRRWVAVASAEHMQICISPTVDLHRRSSPSSYAWRRETRSLWIMEGDACLWSRCVLSQELPCSILWY